VKTDGKTYSQRLTPDEVQTVLDALLIPWRDYKPDESGWIAIDGQKLQECTNKDERFRHVFFEGRPSFNIIHGGWMDHNSTGYLESVEYDMEADERNIKKSIKGDIVDLVRYFHFGFRKGTDKSREAITFINSVLGKRQVDEKAFTGKIRAKDFINKKLDIFVIVPKQLLQAKISASAKIVWCEIHDQCRKGKYCAWPSIVTISKRANISRSTVIRALQELEETGFLIIQKKDGANNLYYPVLPDNKPDQYQNETGI